MFTMFGEITSVPIKLVRLSSKLEKPRRHVRVVSKLHSYIIAIKLVLWREELEEQVSCLRDVYLHRRAPGQHAPRVRHDQSIDLFGTQSAAAQHGHHVLDQVGVAPAAVTGELDLHRNIVG